VACLARPGLPVLLELALPVLPELGAGRTTPAKSVPRVSVTGPAVPVCGVGSAR
jgi:hypothetical protein